jgi:Cdc6-like AAA superfamily ATPase
MSENNLTHIYYNLIDVDGNILEENVSHAQALETIENSIDTEYIYFYYPLDETILAELVERDKENPATELRFFKQLPPVSPTE